MDNKIYLITLVEIIAFEDPIITHHGVVIGDETKARKMQRKQFVIALTNGWTNGVIMMEAFSKMLITLLRTQTESR